MSHQRNKNDFKVIIKRTGKCNNCFVCYRGKLVCACGSSLPSKNIAFFMESAKAAINEIILGTGSFYAHRADEIDKDLAA